MRGRSQRRSVAPDLGREEGDEPERSGTDRRSSARLDSEKSHGALPANLNEARPAISVRDSQHAGLKVRKEGRRRSLSAEVVVGRTVRLKVQRQKEGLLGGMCMRDDVLQQLTHFIDGALF